MLSAKKVKPDFVNLPAKKADFYRHHEPAADDPPRGAGAGSRKRDTCVGQQIGQELEPTGAQNGAGVKRNPYKTDIGKATFRIHRVLQTDHNSRTQVTLSV